MDTITFHQLQQQVEKWSRSEGLNMIDLLEMADPLRQVMNWLVRQDQVTIAQIQQYLQIGQKETEEILLLMVKHNLITLTAQNDQVLYRVQLITRTRRSAPTKSILDDFYETN